MEVLNENAFDEELETNEILKDMEKNLNELPTDVLNQLLANLEEIDSYNKSNPDEISDNN